MKIFTICIIVCSVLTCKNTQDAMTSEKQNNQSITGNYMLNSIEGEEISFEDLTITFDEKDNSVFGYSGCNRFSGSYQIEGNNIKIGPLASTRMSCQTEQNDVEYKILQALAQVNSFQIENTMLHLKKDEKIIIVAKKNSYDLSQYTITYNAVTRGTYINFIIADRMISIQNKYNQKPIKNDIPREIYLQLLKDLEDLDLDNLSSLEPPSKAYQYDGALGATLTVIHNGSTFKTPTFDHGNPPKSIEQIVNKILSMKKLVEKQ